MMIEESKNHETFRKKSILSTIDQETNKKNQWKYSKEHSSCKRCGHDLISNQKTCEYCGLIQDFYVSDRLEDILDSYFFKIPKFFKALPYKFHPKKFKLELVRSLQKKLIEIDKMIPTKLILNNYLGETKTLLKDMKMQIFDIMRIKEILEENNYWNYSLKHLEAINLLLLRKNLIPLKDLGIIDKHQFKILASYTPTSHHPFNIDRTMLRLCFYTFASFLVVWIGYYFYPTM